ncbi:MAG: hypothetical protein WBD50_06020 [Candidatus Rhabdochlamydia sp.]
MTPVNNTFDPKLEFELEQFKNLQSCIEHCNLRIKNEQRSWTKIVYDNKITMIALVASSVITRFALNSLFSMSMVALPLAIVPILYATYKLSSLQDEASNRLIKTQQVFCNVSHKYEEKMFPSQENNSIGAFIKHFTDSPRKFSSLEAKERADEIITKYGDHNGCGSLVKVVSNQLAKDQRYLDKINAYQSTFQMGSTAILLTALNIDQFFGPYSFLASKPFLITSILFTTGIIGGYAAHSYIKHWNDGEIGKDAFREALPGLNELLKIPQEHHAYS